MRLICGVLSFAVLLACCHPCLGQGPATVAFYNVENLYDTIPSLFYDDSDYTPQGRLRWGAERYERKLVNLARVIDDISADIIALAEVENETVVRDLVVRLSTDYNYIHRTGGDSRGIDLAVLYKGDRFVPELVRLLPSGFSREFLYVRGELDDTRLDIIVCHLPSQRNEKDFRRGVLTRLSRLADSLHRNDAGSNVLVMGDFNTEPSERIMRRAFGSGGGEGVNMFFSPLAALASRGAGSYMYDNRWRLYDNIFLSVNFLGQGGLRYRDAGVFIRDYILDPATDGVFPFRTFSRGLYRGGFSDHLPVFVILSRPE